MPGNPLSDPNWPTQLADQVERVVTAVREKTTTPIVHATRAVVFGLLAALVGILALVLLLVALTRGLQALLELAVSWERAVYLSYLILGGILCLAGALLLRKRHSADA